MGGKRIEGEELIEKKGEILLMIEKTKVYGNMTCRAENRHGVAEEHFMLQGEELMMKFEIKTMNHLVFKSSSVYFEF